jgi:hypothetical protein
MSSDDQKIIHRWNYESRKSTWRAENSNNVGGVLDHLKLGLDGETTLNIPDTLKKDFSNYQSNIIVQSSPFLPVISAVFSVGVSL